MQNRWHRFRALTFGAWAKNKWGEVMFRLGCPKTVKNVERGCGKGDLNRKEEMRDPNFPLSNSTNRRSPPEN